MVPWLIAVITALTKSIRQARRSSLLPLLAPFLLLIAIGTVAYARLENWTFFDALYATIITITTVGYGDLSPHTAAGRAFAIFFTLFAIGLAGYALSTAAATVFEGHHAKLELKRLKNRMQQIAALSTHVIICGGGILANRAASEFSRRKVPFVIIEADEVKLKHTLLWLHAPYVEKRQRHYATLAEVDLSIEERKTVQELAEETGILYMLEDPTDEQQLRAAGVNRAYGVVAAMEDDRDNTTIILSARDMARRLDNAKLRIVASARNELNMHTLYLAGADRVISPNIMGGFTVASQMLDHDTAELWDQMLYQSNEQMRFGDLKAVDYPELIGKTTDDVRRTLAQLVLAIRRDGKFLYTPEPTEIVQRDDTLIVMGPNLQP
ncbi:MAG: NAD-binding protein [Caldilineaceae bacterium]